MQRNWKKWMASISRTWKLSKDRLTRRIEATEIKKGKISERLSADNQMRAPSLIVDAIKNPSLYSAQHCQYFL